MSKQPEPVTLRNGAVVQDPRLDRIPQWDPRNLQYPVREVVQVAPIRKRSWKVAQMLDQGPDGACVGFGWAHELIATPDVNIITEKYAKEQIYWEAQKIDEYPGGEYPGAKPAGQQGSSVLAGAKVVQKAGFMKEYRWATNLSDILHTLSQLGPVVMGTDWYENMMDIDAGGLIHATGRIVGGHCYALVGVDPVAQTVKIQQSWGKSWGVGGQCYLSWSDLQMLLNSQGEACVPVGRKIVKLQ